MIGVIENPNDKIIYCLLQVDGLDDINTEKEMILASNRSLAEFNLSRERQLTDGKLQLQQSSEQGQKLLESIETLAAQLSKFVFPPLNFLFNF